ncbi:heat-shock protein [Staphylococcus saprophyticus]|jgi:HSP20 family protein|uniref:Putative small heat shock protein n=1 Tax=Staphylococcus saprophyticus subsp. saprophyticus (strain ATCC 15305 / DSM 20229 / NCIMB 8711 / NCTC 7292 / S-41) TaxID=342451 RepID=Q49ZX5_STAS1|nr:MULTISPECIES: Hsp20/alpha crystallin family protein [Staphylococcus]CRV27162.1 molecular chaperone (small heat shock protein) [Streptococcus equi subsp. equi]AMG19576.1 Hsp20/alpha crystallin family protein [Staphylococcus saprophyticus]AMG32690.1 Hsp20/alpha crystallin family protein [Staphylococcus saprophyticus]ASE58631.1 Hsp20/alpha crystallin family protein [Staphylococcus saprophyticus]ASF19598.1 Hsp20/alpha crystallin family protein [Staphylococcus saprophyticus]
MAFDMRPFNNSFFEGNPGDLFKDFGRQFFEQFPDSTSIKSDVKELDNAYVVEAELPGFQKENISLQFENNVLTIEGKQVIENNEEDEAGRLIHQERSTSNVKRQYPFENVDENAIKASYENGMLNVTLPKKTQEERSSSNIQID